MESPTKEIEEFESNSLKYLQPEQIEKIWLRLRGFHSPVATLPSSPVPSPHRPGDQVLRKQIAKYRGMDRKVLGEDAVCALMLRWDVHLCPHTGLAFEQFPVIPQQHSLMKADELSLQEKVFKDVLIVCLWLSVAASARKRDLSFLLLS
ncbi:Calcium/calmodulin-dependent 3',5'-cyclic nucleotide phosphodiesterase 1C [Anas platyrhynchos]|uniref:Calcium/calmodulin-dependent 3',5'-cyclic nucleotide phosphodiesterase 1C n=1 Tax=Anas platyrhynchos TaxID=8839 RepID=R0LIA8_ANAPL|nr:Calcium/calmodulin-dependent 3',5'-cyclic nucleotide phosphodiesterase 1C [Anas platyrhynchos]